METIIQRVPLSFRYVLPLSFAIVKSLTDLLAQLFSHGTVPVCVNGILDEPMWNFHVTFIDIVFDVTFFPNYGGGDLNGPWENAYNRLNSAAMTLLGSQAPTPAIPPIFSNEAFTRPKRIVGKQDIASINISSTSNHEETLTAHMYSGHNSAHISQSIPPPTLNANPVEVRREVVMEVDEQPTLQLLADNSSLVDHPLQSTSVHGSLIEKVVG